MHYYISLIGDFLKFVGDRKKLAWRERDTNDKRWIKKNSHLLRLLYSIVYYNQNIPLNLLFNGNFTDCKLARLALLAFYKKVDKNKKKNKCLNKYINHIRGLYKLRTWSMWMEIGRRLKLKYAKTCQLYDSHYRAPS